MTAWEQVGAFFGLIAIALWFALCYDDGLPEPPRRKLAERQEFAYTIDPGMRISRGEKIEAESVPWHEKLMKWVRYVQDLDADAERPMCVACGFELTKGHDCNAY